MEITSAMLDLSRVNLGCAKSHSAFCRSDSPHILWRQRTAWSTEGGIAMLTKVILTTALCVASAAGTARVVHEQAVVAKERCAASPSNCSPRRRRPCRQGVGTRTNDSPGRKNSLNMLETRAAESLIATELLNAKMPP